MSGWMGYFGGRKDPKATTRDAIVTLRQQLQMLEKKDEYLNKKIEEELRKAKANAISNKTGESCCGWTDCAGACASGSYFKRRSFP